MGGGIFTVGGGGEVLSEPTAFMSINNYKITLFIVHNDFRSKLCLVMYICTVPSLDERISLLVCWNREEDVFCISLLLSLAWLLLLRAMPLL